MEKRGLEGMLKEISTYTTMREGTGKREGEGGETGKNTTRSSTYWRAVKACACACGGTTVGAGEGGQGAARECDGSALAAADTVQGGKRKGRRGKGR
jgi:hypothetical protein